MFYSNRGQNLALLNFVIIAVENPKHCDFTRLRQMLISTHMQDLKDVTCDIHYENYRAEHISEQMGTQHKERK